MMSSEREQGTVKMYSAERGFGFDDAVAIFAGPVLEWEDQRQDWGERRILAVGEAHGHVLAIVYTERGSRRRIISA